jgi:hypothetical protein
MAKQVIDGKVIRNGDKIIITVVDEPYSLKYGAECLNPSAPEEEREYQRIFINRRIYLPKELPEFRKENFAENVFVISMNGYSSLRADWLKANGLKEGAYEAACESLFKEIYRRFKEKLPKVKLVAIYGVSDTGVDLAISRACSSLGIEPLGFTCPRYALYMADSGAPVYLANNADDYADIYVQSLHFLICAGGREQALKHDVFAACVYEKKIYFVDLPSMLSENNHVNAVVEDANGRRTVNNAAAAFGTSVSFFDRSSHSDSRSDVWAALYEDVANMAYTFARKKLAAKYTF